MTDRPPPPELPEGTPAPTPPPVEPVPPPAAPGLEPPVPTAPGDPNPQPSPPPVGVAPPPRSGMSGCAKAAIIGGIVVAVVVVAALAFAFFGLRRFVDNIDTELTASDSCAFITDDEASEALGVTVSVESGDSGLGSILGMIRDSRLLADQPYCFVNSEDSGTQAWVSLYEGGDAEAVFASSEDIADGQVVSNSSDASGSLSVETDPFRGEDVEGLGDEAFCTDPGATVSGGVLARAGNRVVYISILPLAENQGADVLDGSLCERAVPLARTVLDLPT